MTVFEEYLSIELQLSNYDVGISEIVLRRRIN